MHKGQKKLNSKPMRYLKFLGARISEPFNKISLVAEDAEVLSRALHRSYLKYSEILAIYFSYKRHGFQVLEEPYPSIKIFRGYSLFCKSLELM